MKLSKIELLLKALKKHELQLLEKFISSPYFNSKKDITSLFIFSNLQANDNLKFYIQKALKNNLQLNAERKNFDSAKQSKNISRSEFLPSITISGDQSSSTSTSRKNQSGASLADTNSDSESTTISVEQKIFSGFKGLNTFKKSELETQKANLKLKQVEQQTIINTASAYFDLI